MARHVWSVLCKRGIWDKNTNLVSMVDVLEGIEFSPPGDSFLDEGKQWHGLPTETAIVSMIERSDYDKPEVTKLRLQVAAPNGTIFKESTEVEINLLDQRLSRSFVNIPQLLFFSSGFHRFLISLQEKDGDWKKVADIPLQLEQKKKST